ncbi:hypothetical protein BGW38_007670 [Lunasporangiospora selenospora]|uniref:Uncharacterized protein n=1 Tax=Lunasporangiospora selenospora TaxID=979761 RepID=A0A9P6G4R5_9FUNG|nr:hypothetical protein BGW38_007670 [Lunasporangiospora selenospora]
MNRDCLHTLAVNLTYVFKVERPDFLYHFLEPLSSFPSPFPSPSPSPSSSSPSFSSSSPPSSPSPPSPQNYPKKNKTRSQFHHYIPQFILKTFADNFTLDKTVFISSTPSQDPSGFEPSTPKKPKSKKRPNYYINVCLVKYQTKELVNTAHVYGVKDIYRDFTEDDCMKFEKLLSKHECTSSTFIRQVWDEETDLSLTRAQLSSMKRFLVVMMYRGERRRSQYFDQNFEPLTEMSVKKHMEHKRLPSVPSVWFDNLKWIIEASPETLLMEFTSVCKARKKSMSPTALIRSYRGPIHGVEMEVFGCIMSGSIACIWQAEKGSEFILTEGCYGAWDGDVGIQYHHLFIVSSRFAIVLVNKVYLEERTKRNLRYISWFGDHLHTHPVTEYKNEPLPENFNIKTDYSHLATDDVFKYKRIVVPKEDVYRVNSISIDDNPQTLTYKSSISMYKSLRYYDKVKEDLFHDCIDYSSLRRKLFSDLNRTHQAEQ